MTSCSQECSSPKLWKKLCERTGKSKGALVCAVSSARSTEEDSFFDLYHRIPCVPQDFSSITQALEVCPPGGTITLLPGVYHERIVIRSSVRIRAADPRRGAAIVWHHRTRNNNDDDSKQETQKNTSAIEIEDSCTYVSLQHLNILHFSRGNDIWNGNCAVFCHGHLTHTVIHGCSIQSDSGRGVVVANGASLKLAQSTVHDCAATGLYVGHIDSIVNIANCNILRNGFGPPDDENDDSETLIHPGHSGLYVEAAEAEIRNTLLAENCLTGLSVVRQGMVHISESDITTNGEEPIVILDEPNDSAEGGVVYEFSNTFDCSSPLQNGTDEMIRCSLVHNKFLTKSMLNKMYTD